VKDISAIYQAISAANESILYATSLDTFYQGMSNALCENGPILGCVVYTPSDSSANPNCAAFAGARPLAVSADNVGQSFTEVLFVESVLKSGKPDIRNFLAHHRMLSERDGQPIGIASALALPLKLEKDPSFGVVIFYSDEENIFDEPVITLLTRLLNNLIFAVNKFITEFARREKEIFVHANGEKYRNIIDSIEDLYYEVDLHGTLLYTNQAFARMLGYECQDLVGMNYRQIQTEEVSLRVYKVFNAIYKTGVPTASFDWELVRKDGEKVMLEGSVQLTRDAQNNPTGFCGILRNVTELRRMVKALRDSEFRFRALTNLSSDWYWELDADFRYKRIKGRQTKADLHQDSLIGLRPWETPFEIQVSGGWKGFQLMLSSKQSFRDVICHRFLQDGSPFYISISGEPVFDDEGQFEGYRAVTREITEQKIAEERIQYLATHDVLTKLPNRVMFSQLLNVEIPAAKRYNRKFAVLFIDLDRFKVINDTLGHIAGDELLQETASRFRSILRESDVIARLGGDEFVVLLLEADDVPSIEVVARKLLSAAMSPHVLAGQECRVTSSIGIAMYPADGEDEQTLMKNADIAMYFAKEEGKNNYQFYSSEIQSQSLERFMIEENLRRGLEREEFSLYYQAKVDLKSNTISGVEALLRWHNAQLGPVSPIKFIPIAEETGFIIPLGKWVLKKACEQNMAWQKQGLPPLCIAVNISVRQFSDDNLLNDIATVLHDTCMDPHLLELEITEGMLVQNPTRAINLLTSIKKMGVRLAIDDFGTGYSSLSQLKEFPIDTLKVDRSFIRDIATNADDKAITNAIIMMGKTLSLMVVAEGVETMEQETFLRDHACDQMQGYYFSKPISADDFTALLCAHSKKM